MSWVLQERAVAGALFWGVGGSGLSEWMSDGGWLSFPESAWGWDSLVDGIFWLEETRGRGDLC